MKKQETSKKNLYFIIRSVICGLMGFSIFLVIAFVLGNLNYVQAIILSSVSFASPMFLSKILHKKIENLVEKVFIYLKYHKKISRLLIKILK